MDEHGAKIRASFFRDAADAFYDVLDVDNVYYMSNGKVVAQLCDRTCMGASSGPCHMCTTAPLDAGAAARRCLPPPPSAPTPGTRMDVADLRAAIAAATCALRTQVKIANQKFAAGQEYELAFDTNAIITCDVTADVLLPLLSPRFTVCFGLPGPTSRFKGARFPP